MAEATTQPEVTCKGLTFLPVPKFDGLSAVFGADEKHFFNRRDLPDVPRQYEDIIHKLFFSGGEIPVFGADVDRHDASIALRAWLSSFAPAHEAKVATAAYALWVWSPEAAAARAAQAKA